MPPFITGLFFGLVFIFSLGPGFFALVQTSVQKGFRKAVLLAIGVSLSDMMYVVLALMGVASLLEEPSVKFWMAIVGTVVLFGYGLYSWFRKPKIYSVEELQTTDAPYLMYVAKGFLLNGLNPFIVVFWVSIIGFVSVNYEMSSGQQIPFFAGVLTTIFSMDMLKAFLAQRVRCLVTPRSILIMNRSVAAILMLFGIQMLYFVYSEFWAG